MTRQEAIERPAETVIPDVLLKHLPGGEIRSNERR